MKGLIYTLLSFSVVILFSCGEKGDSTISFTSDNIDTIGYLHTLSPNRWYKTVGNIAIDSAQVYKDEKPSD